MIMKLFNFIKKFIVAILLIYAYNKMTLPMNLFIPMNIFTVFLVTFFGIPAVIMLIFFSLICI